jgi:hypothetical protein
LVDSGAGQTAARKRHTRELAAALMKLRSDQRTRRCQSASGL